ncbi:Global nitrogen regulator [bioreactor metagenome]|uniref:Global nitrogen regulator n=1 Tax=bioreactor metagenome TaxID=1076179 RepID=A0A644ZTM0_9ZZZZ
MDKLKDFLTKYKTIKYKKGQILVRPEDTFDKIIIEKEGFTRVYQSNDEGKEVSWPILKPMWLFSWVTAFNKGKSQYFVETVTNMEAWAIPIEEFDKFLKEEIYSEVIKGLINLSLKTEELILADAYTKVKILLADLANNFGKKSGKEVLIDFNIPHRVWASITGMTRETVTLQILKMQKQGLLKNQKRNILIKDISKLK